MNKLDENKQAKLKEVQKQILIFYAQKNKFLLNLFIGLIYTNV